jgi:hypothetical protein
MAPSCAGGGEVGTNNRGQGQDRMAHKGSLVSDSTTFSFKFQYTSIFMEESKMSFFWLIRGTERAHANEVHAPSAVNSGRVLRGQMLNYFPSLP